MRLITHDGSFHADDVLAYAVLSGLSRYKDANLVRTRDAKLIGSAGVDDVVFDVGFEFDPIRNRFDHHMRIKPLREETHDGQAIPYSSVGLVWRFFGEDFLLENFPQAEPLLTKVWSEVDRTLILPTDMTDNGIGESFAATSLAGTIDDLNQSWDDDEEHGDDLFLQAVDLARTVFSKRIERAISDVLAFDLASEAIASSPDPQIIVLPRSMPWEAAMYDGEHEDALYVISEKRGTWYCQAVRPHPGSFAQRKPLPEEWAGLDAEELARVTGVDDAVFCHAMRFVCAAGSLEGALTMARMAVGNDLAPKAG